MSAPLEHRALRRKIAAQTRAAPVAADLTAALGRAFGRALRRAGGPFEGLGLQLGAVSVTAMQNLEAAIAALPENGLAAALEDAGGRRGLIGLSPGLVDALVEVQTTGRVEAADLPPRPVTRIDETLTRDFIDLVLAGFAQEAQGVAPRDWPERMGYASRILDRRQITLLMPEGGHLILAAELGFDGVDRRAAFVMVFPQDPALARGEGAVRRKPADAAWQQARAHILSEIRLPLDVILLRLIRPLAEVQQLAVGDLLPFASADLAEVALENTEGRALAHGRLGQLGGRRALRLPGAVPQGAQPMPAPAGADDPALMAAALDELAARFAAG
jgi:flagellar motor switch protein FliM